MLTARAILESLQKEQNALTQGVMTNPPSNWEEFNKRLGMWVQLETTITKLEQALKRNEEN